jgi:glycosyltransferase involved in cell wall biosynthesis
LRVPYLITPYLQLGDPDDPRYATRRAYLSPALLDLARSADRLFLQTEAERQALRELGFPDEQLVLQGMGVDLASCTGGDRDKARAAWGCGPDDLVVGHLANQSREKGTIDLLRAAQRAWQEGSRCRVVLAGPEMQSFRAFWAGFRPRGIVHRLGTLSEQQKRDFFAALDVHALPSRSDSFGLVLLEAWANGAANVVYRAGGLPWIVRDGSDGLVVPCGDVKALAAALLRLEREPNVRRRMGEAGRARLAEFHWDEKLELVHRLYRELTESRVGTL